MSILHRVAFTACLVVAASAASFGGFAPCQFTEPAAGFCTSPRIVSGTPGHHVVLMDAAGALGSVPLCGVSASNLVYFDVTPTVSGLISISTCHPATAYDTVVEVWSNFGADPCLDHSVVACNDDTNSPVCDNGCSFFGSFVQFNAVAGTKYRIVVGAVNSFPGNCGSLCLGLIVTIGQPCGAAPTNIVCQWSKPFDATPDPNVWLAFTDVTDAFSIPSGPNLSCNSGATLGHTVWFNWTAPANGRVVVSTCRAETNYDTVLVAYIVSDCLFYSEVACNDDYADPTCINGCSVNARGSRIEFHAVKGTIYSFQIGSYDDNSAQCATPLCLGVRLEAFPCPADLDGDGVVDVFDLAVVIGNWGFVPGPAAIPADITGDGVVDVFDLAELIGSWGACP